ncbi:uncharacterized protein LOC111808006 isoform X2 [Cucurbita pepo subsp. pepo]|uniref:uncharacterized protein LOC111808006 isoform X2 n=1 Tax=Cucurbita pepo subsp. pepo TaxID=3664 RepID=UPI000C9D80CD|nr:uncharacterized protein LOC111808006 isoform X2 [Cucurbita pepo subsp. pepo]
MRGRDSKKSPNSLLPKCLFYVCIFSLDGLLNLCLRVSAPMVMFLMENLEKSGCGIGDKFIKNSSHISVYAHANLNLILAMISGGECVRRRVMKSVAANPYCSEAAAKDAMEGVWDVCYNDTQLFDRAP